MSSADQAGEALYARVSSALIKWGQRHVLELLAPHEAESSASVLLRDQLLHFERWYRGGLDTYLSNATQLYYAQQQSPGANATATAEAQAQDEYADWIPSVPRSSHSSDDAEGGGDEDAPLDVAQLDSELFRDLEAVGLRHIGKSAFVVVAGGLGERLGYAGIKLKLPVETLTSKSYLECYIQHLLALQVLANANANANDASDNADKVRIPLAIMTSDVTHDATWEFLVANAFFGMEEQQVALIKQEKVPCLNVDPDNSQQLQLAVSSSSSSNTADDDGSKQQHQLVMKPHGHGDVHSLLHSSGLASKWEQQGKKYVHFFQDTNFLIVNSFLPMLGASVRNNWAFNFTSVQRKAKDASGAVVRFSQPNDEDSQVAALFNVEYHELDQFLRTKAQEQFPDGDVNDPSTGFSLFPGNINHFVIELESYNKILNVSKGFVPELFNPKTKFDAATKTRSFTSPARLECMMQDYPKLLVQFQELLSSASETESPSAPASPGTLKSQQQNRIGLVLFPPSLVYSPCKNDVVSAKAKAQQDIPPQCAGSAEHDLFAVNREKLAALGIAFADVDSGSENEKSEWLGIPLDCSGPQIVYSSSFAASQSILRSKFPSPAEIRISRRSTLVVNGDVTLHKLALDGALLISACAGATVEIKSLNVENAGYKYEPVEMTEKTDPIDAMRGYQFRNLGLRELFFDAPGHYTIEE